MGESTWHEMTPAERINEAGTEPDCPFCANPRVSRTCYIRCNHCGINWLDSEMHLLNYLSSDPRVARKANVHMDTETPDTAEPSVEDAE